jgi:hypothetical protein
MRRVLSLRINALLRRATLSVVVALLWGCSPAGDEGSNEGIDSGAYQDVEGDTSSPEADAPDASSPEDSDVRDVVCGDPDDHLRLWREITALEGCDVFRGWINLGDMTDVSFAEFPSLRVIEGRLNLFRNEYLESLEGFERLERLGEFYLHHSVVLDDLSELSNLQEVEGGLFISSNYGITSLEGLEQLQAVGDLRIDYNPELASLNGLAGLERVRGDVTIKNNDIPQAEVQAFLDRVQIDGEVDVDF